jgi:DNA ligase-1
MFSPMLAHEYADDINPTGWWVSTKLDGVRALWTGSQLVSRTNKPVPAPAWFTANLAPIPLDGELWIGNGRFQEVADIVKRKKPIDSDWQNIAYVVFDTPNDSPFEDRYALIRKEIPLSPYCFVLPHSQCRDRADLEAHYLGTLEDGGEGVMLRAYGSTYEHGRSEYLLKYKPTFTTEGILTATEAGQGRLADCVGTMLLEWNGLTVRLGSGIPDNVRQNPPAIGSLIEFEHKGLTIHGQPRHATFRTVRNYE